MGQFIKFAFASCLGIFLFTIAVIGFFAIAGLASGGKSTVSIKPNTVLELNFDDAIPELTDNLEKEKWTLEPEKTVGLQDIVKSIKHAATDKNIKGILMYPKGGVSGAASTESIRNALKEFKDSGKFIYSYATFYEQNNYYLASTADSVYIHPMGFVDFRGFAASIPFLKEMLDNIGIDANVFYAGDFKSATEPIRRTNISEPNRMQLKQFLGQIYDNVLTNISDSRNMTKERIHQAADNLELKNAEIAVSVGFVDRIVYRDELMDVVKDRMGLDDDEKVKRVSLNSYFSTVEDGMDFSAKDKIVVLYAEGDIVDGKGEAGQIGSNEYVKMIDKIRKDDKVKGIVLRVNSGGGSALSSENIWRELKLAQAAGKKIVVSMGDYAASGGYYIACAADSIFAEPQTLTGSIGVFSIVPNTQKLMNDKIGIRFDTVTTAKHAAAFNIAMEQSTEEKAFFQGFVDRLYERFLKRVGDARGWTRDEAHAVAQGRVWTGTKALELGLVDKLGTMDDAIESVATLSGLEKYRLVTYPKTEDPIEKLIKEITNPGGDDDDIIVKAFAKEMKAFGIDYEAIQQIKAAKMPQYKMPYQFNF